MMGASTKKIKVMVVLGTRQEAIKAAPIIERLRHRKLDFEPIIVAISHARDFLDHTLTLFNISPDIVLNLTHIRQGLPSLTSYVLENMTIALENTRPDIVLVQGNSTAAFAGSLAAFNLKIPIGHIASESESYFNEHPSPEDVNRRLTAVMADMHFASTRFARHCLLAEGVCEKNIIVTGNPLIDALKHISTLPFIFSSASLQKAVTDGKRLVVFAIKHDTPANTALQTACRAARELVCKFANVDVILPVSAGAIVDTSDASIPGGTQRIHLIDAPDEVTFVNLLKNSHVIITDSDQIPEEASVFQKPVLILKNGTKSAPGVYTLSARTVESDPATIVQEAGFLLNNTKAYQKMLDPENPYGDGQAAERIVTALKRWSKDHQHLLMPAEEFSPRNPLTDLLCQNS